MHDFHGLSKKIFYISVVIATTLGTYNYYDSMSGFSHYYSDNQFIILIANIVFILFIISLIMIPVSGLIALFTSNFFKYTDKDSD